MLIYKHLQTFYVGMSASFLDLPSEPRNVRLVQSTLSYIRITWDPPVEPGISVISDYFMEWTHPNQTITSINYTVLNQGNPVLDYTFKNLYPEQNYKVVMSAYNAVGQGKRTGEVTFQSVVKGGKCIFGIFYFTLLLNANISSRQTIMT